MATAVAPANPTSLSSSATTMGRSRVVPACTALVLALYAVSAVLSASDASTSDFHRRQAAALADGHFDIRPVPHELTELDDPYDAEQNLDVRVEQGVQDLAYRDGRLYSAHGLTIPVLLAPIELAFDTSPPNWAITLVAGWCGVLAGVSIMLQLRRRYMPDLPNWAVASTVLAFGLCGPVWVLMSSANGYEATIAAAFALSTVGAALLLRATEPLPHLSRWRAALGSACLALAVGARPTAIVNVVLVIVVAAVTVRVTRRPCGARRRSADLGAVLGPFAAIGILVALTNFARFGAVTEFGFGYQLSVWDMTRYPKGRMTYLAPNLVDYVTAPPSVRSGFPWIGLRGTIGGDRPSLHTSEPIVGLLFCAPVLAVGALAALSAGADMWRRVRGLAIAVAAAAATGALALVTVSLPFNTSTMRYAADAAPMLLLAACGAWAWARNRRDEDGESGQGGEGGGKAWEGGAVLDRAWLTALAVGMCVTATVQVPA